MTWFRTGTDPMLGWNLSFLGMIPWLGRCAIAPHVEGLIFSSFSLLPRILPGPQVLRSPLKSWPKCYKEELPKLEVNLAFLCCTSHNSQSFVHMVSSTMSSIGCQDPYSINFWDIEYNVERLGHFIDLSYISRIDGDTSPSWQFYVTKLLESLQYLSTADKLNILSFLLTVGLAALSILEKDGAALISLLFLSISSIRDSHSWRVRMKKWKQKSGQKHNVIFKTKGNVFYIAFCDEIAFNTLIHGRSTHFNQLLNRKAYSTTPSDVFLLFSIGLPIFLLANSTLAMQLTIAFGYAILTVIFMLAQPQAVQPGEIIISPRYHLLTSRAHLPNPGARLIAEKNPSLAKTVWSLLNITESSAWVHAIQAIPRTPDWMIWLKEACENPAGSGWPAEAEKRRLVDSDSNAYDEENEISSDQSETRSMRIEPIPVSEW